MDVVNDIQTPYNTNTNKDFKQTDIGRIPNDWEVKTLGELGVFKNGINKNKEDFGFGSPFVNLMDVFGVSEINGNHKAFDLINSNRSEQELYSLKKGDVLFIRSSVKPSGVGLTSVITKDLVDTVYSGFLIRLRFSVDIDDNYKKHCFYEEHFRQRIVASSTVSANTNINQETLKSIQIPLPPTLVEQRAIATALSDADHLIQALEKLIAKKQDIKQGTMQDLLTGKRRLAGFEQQQGMQQTEIGEIPKDWEVVELREISINISSGKSMTGTYTGDYKIYGSTGIIGYSCNFDYHGEKILVARVGANAGRINIVEGEYNISDNTLAITIKKEMFIEFVYFQLIARKLNDLVFGSGQPLITGGQLKELIVFKPIFAEQTAIATILSDMDEEITALEKKLKKYRAIKQGMMQNLLTGKIRLI